MATASLALSTLSFSGYSLSLPKEVIVIILIASAISLIFSLISFIRGVFK